MPHKDKVRVEVGFDGGQIMNSLIASTSATALEEALGNPDIGTVTLDSSEGALIVVLAHVAYVKRHTRGGQVGFLTP
jgi:alpha-acetolactate decarboxylase